MEGGERRRWRERRVWREGRGEERMESEEREGEVGGTEVRNQTIHTRSGLWKKQRI